MNDESGRAAIRRFIDSINTHDMEPVDAIYHDDVVIEWPQSGEVIRGKQNIRELRLAFPTPPTATLRRIVGSGELWVIEMLFDYDGDRYNTIVVHEYRDGLVVHNTESHLKHLPGEPSGSNQLQAGFLLRLRADRSRLIPGRVGSKNKGQSCPELHCPLAAHIGRAARARIDGRRLVPTCRSA